MTPPADLTAPIIIRTIELATEIIPQAAFRAELRIEDRYSYRTERMRCPAYSYAIPATSRAAPTTPARTIGHCQTRKGTKKYKALAEYG